MWRLAQELQNSEGFKCRFESDDGSQLVICTKALREELEAENKRTVVAEVANDPNAATLRAAFDVRMNRVFDQMEMWFELATTGATSDEVKNLNFDQLRELQNSYLYLSRLDDQKSFPGSSPTITCTCYNFMHKYYCYHGLAKAMEEGSVVVPPEHDIRKVGPSRKGAGRPARAVDPRQALVKPKPLPRNRGASVT